MRTLLKILAALVAVILLVAIVGYIWATITTNRARSRTIETHRVHFPIPFPMSEEEAAGLDPDTRRAQERARAIERGRHLVNARYVCVECHGQNFAGGVMVDAFPLGTLLGPNLTAGRGSRTVNYTPTDWDRIVRHGVLPDGRPAVMPSEDFQKMSDQELSDIVSYLRSFPPVDNEVPASTFGPLGRVLVATGQLHFSADQVSSHQTAHVERPPATEASAEFGQHVAAVCTGCHQPDFRGGPITGGDPSWPPARNLTPHPAALGGWTYDQFVHALRESMRPDGTPIRVPMTLIAPYAKNMTDVEMQALWAYLRSRPPIAPVGN